MYSPCFSCAFLHCHLPCFFFFFSSLCSCSVPYYVFDPNSCAALTLRCVWVASLCWRLIWLCCCCCRSRLFSISFWNYFCIVAFDYRISPLHSAIFCDDLLFSSVFSLPLLLLLPLFFFATNTFSGHINCYVLLLIPAPHSGSFQFFFLFARSHTLADLFVSFMQCKCKHK